MIIRREVEADIAAVRAVNIAAFGTPEAPTLEADIADALRANGHAVLSLVAELDDEIVGHAMFSPLTIESDTGETWESIALGPVAVRPDRQRQGIGGMLIRGGLERCRTLGYGAVFLVGHPSYYPRFGFVPASGFGIVCPAARRPEAFQVIELIEESLQGISGTARFGPEFG